jgi:hypothetical protein
MNLKQSFFTLRRNTTKFHVKTEDGQLNEGIMEALHDHLNHRIDNFRKADCDPLTSRRIKRHIILEEFCATSDGQLLGT